MVWRVLADLTLLTHLLFVVFVLLGGLLCLHHRRWAWLHLPAVAWGLWVEFSQGLCPLTPLENYFRRLANDQGYAEGFVEHYLIPTLYPQQWGPSEQWLAGVTVLTINILVYLCILHRRTKCLTNVDE